MSINQILEILKVCSKELEQVNSDPTFKYLSDLGYCKTPNELTLTDALQALYEIESAIEKINIENPF